MVGIIRKTKAFFGARYGASIFQPFWDFAKLMKKVTAFKYFKFEKGALPTISLSPKDFSVQTALRYFLEFLQG